MSITLLATPLVVLALVNLAKRLGLSGAGPLALLAVVLGVLLALGDYAALSGDPHTAAGWYTAGATGLILGLTAAGLYDVASTIGAKTATTLEELTGGDAVEVDGQTIIYDPEAELLAEDAATPDSEDSEALTSNHA